LNSIFLLMGLLLLSYLGSFLVGDRVLRGFGLPSGAEYVMLGFLLGPVFGLVDRSTLGAFEPVANVALGWLALVIGLDYGFVGTRRVRWTRILLGILVALFSGGLVSVALAFYTARFTPDLVGTERWLLVGGVGAACAETTRHAVLWVMQRYHASGKLSHLIAELADSDDVVPLLGIAVTFAMMPTAHLPFAVPIWGWTAVTLGVGLVLGVIAVVLLGNDFRLIQSWGVLLGTSLLTIGMSARAGLSPLFSTFVMGVTIAALSRHRLEIEAMVAPTERPVLLPALLLAGAHLNVKAAPFLPWVVGIAIVFRTLGKFTMGQVIRILPEARAQPLLGLGLMSSGALAMSVGLAFALRFPGRVGDTVLATAAAVTLFGEFVGPAALRSMLRRANEIKPPPEPTETPEDPGSGTPPTDATDATRGAGVGTPLPRPNLTAEGAR
jgi:Kef-type K+ transport system membrane component KefB